MRTKNRLNVGFVMGSIVLAALVGTVLQSGAAFVVALVMLLALNVASREIR